MKMKDIDKHLSASGVVKLIEMKQRESQNRLNSMLNRAGYAKPGMAAGVMASSQAVMSAQIVLKWIEDYLESVENPDDQLTTVYRSVRYTVRRRDTGPTPIYLVFEGDKPVSKFSSQVDAVMWVSRQRGRQNEH